MTVLLSLVRPTDGFFFQGSLLLEPLLKIKCLVKANLRVAHFLWGFFIVLALEPVNLTLSFLSYWIAG